MLSFLLCVFLQSGQDPFAAKPFTDEKSFTTGIEGPACDAQGNVYVVNMLKRGDIAFVSASEDYWWLDPASTLPAGPTVVFADTAQGGAFPGRWRYRKILFPISSKLLLLYSMLFECTQDV